MNCFLFFSRFRCHHQCRMEKGQGAGVMVGFGNGAIARENGAYGNRLLQVYIDIGGSIVTYESQTSLLRPRSDYFRDKRRLCMALIIS